MVSYLSSILILLVFLIPRSLAALPVQSSCGTQTTAPSISGNTLNRIINGADSVSNSWPWTVSLRKYISSTNQVSSHFCAGTLIYEDLVLTAAHCVEGLAASELAVVVGVSNIQTEPATTSNTVFVAHRYYHESYNGDKISSGNDIAILVLAKNLTLNDKIALVCLPASASDSTTVYNKKTVATGWGSTTGDKSLASLSSALKQTTLTVINGNSFCSSRISYDSSRIYCTLDSSTNSNICFGDSGGSIIYYTGSKWYVYGITSFVLTTARGNCDNTLPSYFTQVPAYLTWIEYGLNYTRSGQVQESSAARNSQCAIIVLGCLLINTLL